ncbi:hypothetical protein HYR99_36500 [Candidatus Poribacteria bacterium]|nr:hypothetical protein [Candidatus Poribacteria bacterium]
MYRKRHTLIFVWSILLFCGYGDLLQALENETELDTKLDQLAEDIAVQIPDAVKYIAIVDFAKEDKKVITPFGRYIATVLMQGLLKYGNLKIMKREELEAVIREYEIEMTDFFDPQTMKRLGKFRGVDAILTGTYWNFGTYIQMIATLTDMESANPVLSIRKPISSKWVPDEYIDTDQGDNRPPVWYPQGEPTNQTIIPGEMYELDLSAADPDRDPLVYSVTPIPTGATFDSQTQRFSWRPTKAQHGPHQLTFSVDDRHGGVLSNQVTFTINSPPKLKINDVSIRPGQDFDFNVSAQDNDGDPLIYGIKDLPKGADFNSENGHFVWRNSKRGKFDATFYVQDPYGGIDEKNVRLIVTEPLSIIKGKVSEWVSDGKIGLRVSNVRSGPHSNIDFQIRNEIQRLVTIESLDVEVYDNWGGYQKALISKKPVFNVSPGEVIDDLRAPSVESPRAFLLKVAMVDGEYSGIYLVDISDHTERGEWNPTYWNYILTTEIEQEGGWEFLDHGSDFSTIRESISAKLGERIATIQAKAWASLWDDQPVLIEAKTGSQKVYKLSAHPTHYLLVDIWIYTYRCRGHWLNVAVSHNHFIQAKQYDEGQVSGLDVEIDQEKWRIDDIELMEILLNVRAVYRGGVLRITTWKINGVPTVAWTIPYRVNGIDVIMDALTGDILVPLEDPMVNPETPWTKYDDTNRR